MNAAAAAEGHMTPAELTAWVDQLRADQDLPRRVEHGPSLQRMADLMRAGDGSP